MKVLGIDLGGTQIKYGVVQHGRVLEHAQCKTPAGTYQDVLAVLCGLSAEVIAEYPDVAHIGLAAPGIIDIQAGTVRYSNNIGWENAPVSADLYRATGKTVHLANDAQCATLGEALYGAGQGVSRVAMLTLGTGVGGGFVKDGKLETDGYGAMAYIFGHQTIEINGISCNCGRRGCLEAYASATAIAKQAQGKTAKEVFDAARSGDAASKKIVDAFLHALCVGAVNVANLLRPQTILIGGGVSGAADLILPAVNAALQKEVYGFAYAPVKAAAAKLGNLAGVVGAANLGRA